MVSDNLTADLTLKETSVLSGTPEKSIRHELAARIVRAGRARGRRKFSPREVVYFVLVNELPIGLDKKLRKELFDLLATNKERAGRWRREAHGLVLEGDVSVVLPTDDVVKRIEDRVGTFLRGRSRRRLAARDPRRRARVRGDAHLRPVRRRARAKGRIDHRPARRLPGARPGGRRVREDVRARSAAGAPEEAAEVRPW